MNEPVQFAQKKTGKVTAKQLLDVLKAGGSAYMHGVATYGREDYSDSFVFTVSSANRRNTTEVITKIDVPGWVSNGTTSNVRTETGTGSDRYVRYDETFRPRSGFWSFRGGEEGLVNILELLPPGAQVAFHVYLDAGTNEYLVRADCPMNFGVEKGLHGDKCYLVAWWERRGKRVERRFLVDDSVCAHNSARFGVSR